MVPRRVASPRIALHTEINAEGWVRVVAAWRVTQKRPLTQDARQSLEREIVERLADLTITELDH